MSARAWNALFLCTGNSARSILAEAILNAEGEGRFRAYSAGSRPAGRVNPLAIELLASRGFPTAGLRSKGWEEFAAPGAPAMDFVLTVCDAAAAETCPVWPGRPTTAHWGVPDPATVGGDDEAKRRAFLDAYGILRRRIARLLSLPLDGLDPPALRRALAEIGKNP